MNKDRHLFEFIKYASMNVMGMLAVSCYILADTFFVSKGMGTAGLAALNLAIPVFGFTTGCGLLLGMGGSTKYSVSVGKGDLNEARAVFTNTLFMAAAASCVFFSAGSFFSEKITSLMGADEQTFDMTHTYIKTILMFSPAFIMNHTLQCFVRNDGRPQVSMLAMISGSFSNIILDYVFIFPLKMGIFGAAIATCLAPVISLCILSVHLLSGRSKLRPRKIKLVPARIGSAVSLGIPSMVTEISSSVVIMVYNAIIMGIAGNVGVAAYGVIANLSLVVVSVYNGIAQGSQPLLSSAFGRGDMEAMRRFFRYALLAAVALSAAVYMTAALLSEPIAGIFNSEKDDALQSIAEYGLKLYFIGAIFVGYNIITAVYFTSMEKGLPAQMISTARGLVVMIPMAFLLSELFGITGVWLSFPATEGSVSLISLFLRKYFDRPQAKGV